MCWAAFEAIFGSMQHGPQLEHGWTHTYTQDTKLLSSTLLPDLPPYLLYVPFPLSWSIQLPAEHFQNRHAVLYKALCLLFLRPLSLAEETSMSTAILLRVVASFLMPIPLPSTPNSQQAPDNFLSNPRASSHNCPKWFLQAMVVLCTAHLCFQWLLQKSQFHPWPMLLATVMSLTIPQTFPSTPTSVYAASLFLQAFFFGTNWRSL